MSSSVAIADEARPGAPGLDELATSLTARAYDAVIVGAGPSGSSAAAWLARRGARVAVIERSRFDAPRIGEALVPDVQGELRALDAWDDVLALGPLPSWGTRSIWGGREPHSHSHLASPYGSGWCVDRRAFDAALAEVAARAGAHVLLGATLRATERQHGAWRLHVAVRQGEAAAHLDIAARVLIDATGRAAAVGRALGARRHVFDRLVGVATCWQHPRPDELGHLLVEAAGDGWWYSAPLPPGAHDIPGGLPDLPGERGIAAAPLLAMLMTDADLCARERRHRPAGWQAALAATLATRARLHAARPVGAPRVYPAHSQRLRRSEGAEPRPLPWLAVGDAALAIDPLSGSGVLRALRSGRAGAETAARILERPDETRDALAADEAARDAECTSFLIERAEYYAAEQRFTTPFWARRGALERARAAG